MYLSLTVLVSTTQGSEATKPLPEAGVWGWVRFVHDANGGKSSSANSHYTITPLQGRVPPVMV